MDGLGGGMWTPDSKPGANDCRDVFFVRVRVLVGYPNFARSVLGYIEAIF